MKRYFWKMLVIVLNAQLSDRNVVCDDEPQCTKTQKKKTNKKMKIKRKKGHSYVQFEKLQVNASIFFERNSP